MLFRLYELRKVLLRERHATKMVKRNKFPSCLIRHLNTANRNLGSPYTQSQLKDICKLLRDYLYDIISYESMSEKFCSTLVSLLPEYRNRGIIINTSI